MRKDKNDGTVEQNSPYFTKWRTVYPPVFNCAIAILWNGNRNSILMPTVSAINAIIAVPPILGSCTRALISQF